MSNLHPTFEAILKPHLQGQAVVARKRDTIRYNALDKGWQQCGGLISFGTFLAAVDAYEAARDEAHLDAQFESEQSDRKLTPQQIQNEDDWERSVIEARDRFAFEETPLGEQIEGE